MNGEDAGMDLAEFLQARIAEDEQRARDFEQDNANGTHGLYGGQGQLDGPRDWQAVERIGFTPARVLAECEAKRRIIAMRDDPRRDTYELHDVLAVLALPYATHPDYRSEWSP